MLSVDVASVLNVLSLGAWLSTLPSLSLRGREMNTVVTVDAIVAVRTRSGSPMAISQSLLAR